MSDMSGHSKWHNIKNQKGAEDQRRGLEFTKLANAITVVVKQSGGITDPGANFKLRLLMEKAKAVNMAKEKIQRAIERAKGVEGGQLEEVIYEGFGPSAVALLIEAGTDNRQRTSQEIKNLLEKAGGSLTGPGSTSHFFKNLGQIIVAKGQKSLEEWMNLGIEIGAEDLEELEEKVIFYTETNRLHEVTENLKNRGVAILDAELIYRPLSGMEINDQQTRQKIINLLEELEKNESVQKVFANLQ